MVIFLVFNDDPENGLNWSKFWMTAKEYGFEHEQVHEEARRLFSAPGMKSLKEIIKEPDALNEFLDYLRTLHEQGTEI